MPAAGTHKSSTLCVPHETGGQLEMASRHPGCDEQQAPCCEALGPDPFRHPAACHMCQGMDAEVFAQSLCPQVFLLCLIAASLCKVLSSSAQDTKVGVEGFSNVLRQPATDPKQNQSEKVKNKGPVEARNCRCTGSRAVPLLIPVHTYTVINNALPCWGRKFR